jgi:capsular polysaccharide biosynthesis protein
MRPINFAPPPPGAVLHTVHAPGFSAPPPDIAHAELIPPPIRDAMSTAWHWGEYGPATVTLHHLENVTVADEGLVFRDGHDLVEASITQHTPDEIGFARAAIAAMDGTAPLTGLHVLCVKRGATNYGHWLAEMLPMALLAHRLLGPAVRFIVPRHGGALGDTIRDSLLLAGIGPDQIVKLGVTPCRVQDLVMVQGLSLHGLYLSPLVAELLQELAAPVAPYDPGCRIWASRVGAPRCLWRERDLGTILHMTGWQVVNPGALPFRAQIALFKGAALAAGVMGAGLANLLFAAPGARAEVLAPAPMPDTFFYLISRLRGLRYRETRCPISTPTGPTPVWDGGLVKTLPEVLAILG